MFKRGYVGFLAFKRLVNKNFNHFLTQGDYVQTFFLIKTDFSFCDVSPNIGKNSFLILLIFFPHETSFPKSILNIPGKEGVEAYSEPSRTSNMELFVKIIKDYLLLTIFTKISTLDVWLGAEYASRIFRSFMNEKVCRYTNADLINSLYVHVHSKITPWKFHILNPQNSLVFYPRSLQNVCLQTIRTNRIR